MFTHHHLTSNLIAFCAAFVDLCLLCRRIVVAVQSHHIPPLFIHCAFNSLPYVNKSVLAVTLYMCGWWNHVYGHQLSHTVTQFLHPHCLSNADQLTIRVGMLPLGTGHVGPAMHDWSDQGLLRNVLFVLHTLANPQSSTRGTKKLLWAGNPHVHLVMKQYQLLQGGNLIEMSTVHWREKVRLG